LHNTDALYAFQSSTASRALVEEACVNAGLGRVFHDIEQWTEVKSDDPVHLKTLVVTAEDVEYEELENLSAPSCIVN
jgi:hypothetical protein